MVAFCKLILSSLEQHMNQVPHMLALLMHILLKELLKKFPNDKYSSSSISFCRKTISWLTLILEWIHSDTRHWEASSCCATSAQRSLHPRTTMSFLNVRVYLCIVCVDVSLTFTDFGSAVTVGTPTLKLYAVASKVLLMAGIGSRFHNADSKTLFNAFLDEASTSLLYMLDHVVVRIDAVLHSRFDAATPLVRCLILATRARRTLAS